MEQESTGKRIRAWVSEDGKHAAASMSLRPGGSRGGGTKTGAGGHPQPYGWHGYYGETGGGGKPGTDNEAWRLKEKQFSPTKLVRNARAEIGSKRWHPAQPDGRQVNKCNVFVADKLHESGAPVPNVGGRAGTLGAEASDRLHDMTDGRIGGQPPSANDWHRGKVPGYGMVRTRDGETPQPGDVAASAEHVGIVSGEGKTISVTTALPDEPDFGRVIENDWGFRKGQEGHVTFWRYRGSGHRD